MRLRVGLLHNACTRFAVHTVLQHFFNIYKGVAISGRRKCKRTIGFRWRQVSRNAPTTGDIGYLSTCDVAGLQNTFACVG